MLLNCHSLSYGHDSLLMSSKHPMNTYLLTSDRRPGRSGTCVVDCDQSMSGCHCRVGPVARCRDAVVGRGFPSSPKSPSLSSEDVANGRALLPGALSMFNSDYSNLKEASSACVFRDQGSSLGLAFAL